MARKKKSYPPFKMWGSYLGLLGGLSIHTYINHSRDFLNLFTSGGHVINGILYTFSGFLVGWGVHSLFRSLLIKKVKDLKESNSKIYL